MAGVQKPYGPWSRQILADLRRAGALKAEALVAYLAERGVHVDRTLVSHWQAGRAHLPADLLPHLAELSGRPELVFGPLLRPVRCEVVHSPSGSPDGRELIDLVLEAGARVGRLQRALLEARAETSPGGQTVTSEERAALVAELDGLIQRLSDVRTSLRGKS